MKKLSNCDIIYIYIYIIKRSTKKIFRNLYFLKLPIIYLKSE